MLTFVDGSLRRVKQQLYIDIILSFQKVFKRINFLESINLYTVSFVCVTHFFVCFFVQNRKIWGFGGVRGPPKIKMSSFFIFFSNIWTFIFPKMFYFLLYAYLKAL